MALKKPELHEFTKEETVDDFVANFSGTPGIYVVRADNTPNVFRFGKKENCVARRIKHHAGPSGSFDNISGDLMPYSPKYAWLLKEWPADRVAMAEQAMFGALRANCSELFRSEARAKADRSNYQLPDNFDWTLFCRRVSKELNAIAEFGE